MSKSWKNFSSLDPKLGEIWGGKNLFPTLSLKIGTHHFHNFLHMSHKLKWLKTLKFSRKSVCCVRRYFAFYILVECPVYVGEKILETESILLRSDYDTPSDRCLLFSNMLFIIVKCDLPVHYYAIQKVHFIISLVLLMLISPDTRMSIKMRLQCSYFPLMT